LKICKNDRIYVMFCRSKARIWIFLPETIPAVDWLAFGRLKRNFTAAAAFCACSWVHFPRPLVKAASASKIPAAKTSSSISSIASSLRTRSVSFIPSVIHFIFVPHVHIAEELHLRYNVYVPIKVFSL